MTVMSYNAPSGASRATPSGKYAYPLPSGSSVSAPAAPRTDQPKASKRIKVTLPKTSSAKR